MIRLRWAVQIAFLAVFIALAILLAVPEIGRPAWLLADPLVAVVTLVSSRTFFLPALWSLITIGATMFLGRAFCGWMCPLGTVLDLTDRFLWKRRRGPVVDELRPRARWKQFVLAAAVGASVVGVSAGLVFDPLVLFMRTAQIVLIPFLSWTGLSALQLARYLPGQELLSMPAIEEPPLYAWTTATALVFAGIVALGRVERRFWCRNLCPLGAVLGWLGRTGLLKRYVEGECTSCTRCARDCPMGAIPKDFTQTHRGECILCLNCGRRLLSAGGPFWPEGEGSGAGVRSRTAEGSGSDRRWNRPRAARAGKHARDATPGRAHPSPGRRTGRGVPLTLHAVPRVCSGLPDARPAAFGRRGRVGRSLDAGARAGHGRMRGTVLRLRARVPHRRDQEALP